MRCVAESEGEMSGDHDHCEVCGDDMCERHAKEPMAIRERLLLLARQAYNLRDELQHSGDFDAAQNMWTVHDTIRDASEGMKQ